MLIAIDDFYEYRAPLGATCEMVLYFSSGS
jgi:hypothetical protein